MKWFLLEILQFVKTSNNILGVIFGFFISYLWKRMGKVQVVYLQDKELNVERKGKLVREDGDENFLVDIYNNKGIDLYITETKLKRVGSEYAVLPKDDKINEGTLDEIIIVKAESVKRVCLTTLNSSGGIKDGDIIKFKFHNNVNRFVLPWPCKNINEIKINKNDVSLNSECVNPH